MKKCNKCKEEKDLSEFNKNKWAKDGLMHCCRECDNAKNKLYYLNNVEKKRIKSIAYRNADIEHYRAIINKYYARNKDKVLSKQKRDIDTLADAYIEKSLKRYSKLTVVPPEMIEAKRNLLLMTRLLRSKHE